MAVEFWWWIWPMFKTGFVTLVVFGIPACVYDAVRPYAKLPKILAVLALAPWAISTCGALVWGVINALVLIWR